MAYTQVPVSGQSWTYHLPHVLGADTRAVLSALDWQEGWGDAARQDYKIVMRIHPTRPERRRLAAVCAAALEVLDGCTPRWNIVLPPEDYDEALAGLRTGEVYRLHRILFFLTEAQRYRLMRAVLDAAEIWVEGGVAGVEKRCHSRAGTRTVSLSRRPAPAESA